MTEAPNGDPIWNGADDNASVTVAMLAIKCGVHNPLSDRLYLFGTDLRKGAYCSRYFVSHPTVELSSIAAVLNGDMIGRNAPDSAALLGATEPHLNFLTVAITLAANKSIANFKVDTSWDAADHPLVQEDHLPMLKLMYQQYFYHFITP
jgi:Zn-dependent M28 family amino/carboxypeptidase